MPLSELRTTVIVKNDLFLISETRTKRSTVMTIIMVEGARLRPVRLAGVLTDEKTVVIGGEPVGERNVVGEPEERHEQETETQATVQRGRVRNAKDSQEQVQQEQGTQVKVPQEQVQREQELKTG